MALNWLLETAAADLQWASVAWSPALGLFAAVAYSPNSGIMTSPDGINWTARTNPSSSIDWESICWSPDLGLFCAVSDDSTASNDVMTSPDGITWTLRTVPLASGWISVCWSHEKLLFCAVDYNGNAMTSPDGINWTLRTTPNLSSWGSVTWSPDLGLFCAVAGSSGATNDVMTSPDGITWTLRTVPQDSGWYSVIWSHELSIFCAVASSGTYPVMTSPDGITWTLQSIPTSASWIGIVWSGAIGLFCAVGINPSGAKMTSPDGINWTYSISPAATNWWGITWSPDLGLFCAVGGNNGAANDVMIGASSVAAPSVETDAASSITATTATLNGKLNSDGGDPPVTCSFQYGTTVAYGSTTPGQAVVSGASFSAGISGLTANTTYHFRSVATNSQGTSYGADQVFTTVALPTVTTGAVSSVSYFGATLNGTLVNDGGEASNCSFQWGKTVAYGNETTPTSQTTGQNFLSVISGLSPHTIYHFRAKAVNSAGTSYGADVAFASASGLTWTLEQLPVGGEWTSLAWSPELSLLAAIAEAGLGNAYIVTSPDGVTWTQRAVPAQINWTFVCWSPDLGLFCAVAAGLAALSIMTSPDGINWTLRTVAVSTNWTSVTWSPSLGLFAAIGYDNNTGGHVMTSPDGINWTDRTGVSSASGVWGALVWSPDLGLFVAVAGNSGINNDIMTSPDGITWTLRTAPLDTAWNSIAWSPSLGLFAVTDTSSHVMTSPDGINWTLRQAAASGWHGLAWSPEVGIFCATGNTGVVMTSPDGVHWVSESTASSFQWNGVVWSKELYSFVAVAYNTTYSMLDSPLTRPPTVTTDPATSVLGTSATLNGTLDTGTAPVSCSFEWGLTNAYGNTTTPGVVTVGDTFSAGILGLSPGTTYHFRAKATDSGGTGYGLDATFTTPSAPTVQTDPPTVAYSGASFNGTLTNDGGEACDCGFQWGTTASLGNMTGTTSQTTGQSFNQTFTAFVPDGTLYYVRAFATNSAGTAYGTTLTFNLAKQNQAIPLGRWRI
jgi:hypothetical protein